MGTPEFAVETLKTLVESGENVVAVITVPDKPTGRGQQINQSAVKKYALEQGLKVLQPEKLRSPEFLEELRFLEAELQVVVAFRMLPEVVWSMPKYGTINLHGSLLPQYRGAAPINWAIINGEKVTGVTTFFIKKEIDTGNIIDSIEIPILNHENAGDVHDKMMKIGAELVLNTVVKINKGEIETKPQFESKALKAAPKIFKETCQINWQNTAIDNYNFIRGISPYPTAFTFLAGKILKIYEAVEIIDNILFENTIEFILDLNINENLIIKTDHKSKLFIKCIDNWVSIKVLQLEGKKRMPVDEFLRGFKF